jgi:predicted transcriptional regulator
MRVKPAETPNRRGRRTVVRPQRRATTYRLNPHLQQGLALLGKVRQVSANQMVNEAVGEYLDARTAAVTADLEETLRRVKAYRATDPSFESAIATFAESEARHGVRDPVEGPEDREARPAQRMVRQLIRG